MTFSLREFLLKELDLFAFLRSSRKACRWEAILPIFHLILWDLRPQGLTGSKLELVCDNCCITINKNAVCGDKSALSPGGVRVGTPALTTRGFVEADFEAVAEFLHRAVQIALKVQAVTGKSLKDFRPALKDNADLAQLTQDVSGFASQFPMPGFDAKTMKYASLDMPLA